MHSANGLTYKTSLPFPKLPKLYMCLNTPNFKVLMYFEFTVP